MAYETNFNLILDIVIKMFVDFLKKSVRTCVKI